MYKGVFSDFEVDRVNMRFDTEGEKGTPKEMNCIGSLEEELESRTKQKKCRGRVERTITSGTGNGNLKLSLHCPYELYTELYGMNTGEFAKAVMSYGEGSVHPEGVLTCRVKDEDGEVKYKAYPRVVCSSAKAAKIRNGEDEVAEIELDFAILPDENGKGMYEVLASKTTPEIAEKWMTDFSADLIKKSEETETEEEPVEEA